MLKEYVATHIQYNMQLYDIKNAFQNYWVLWYHIFIQKKKSYKTFLFNGHTSYLTFKFYCMENEPKTFIINDLQFL